MKRFIALFCLLITLISCKVNQHYKFNLDYSGDYTLEFDLRDLANFASDEGEPSEDLFDGMNLDSLADVYKAIDGINNVKISQDTNVLRVSYSFADLDALNKSLLNQGSDEVSLGSKEEKFTVEDGVFKYSIGEVTSGAQSDSLVEMMRFIDYDITMEFKKRFQEVTNGTVQEDGKTVVLTGNFGELAEKKKTLDLEIRFKRFEDEKKR